MIRPLVFCLSLVLLVGCDSSSSELDQKNSYAKANGAADGARKPMPGKQIALGARDRLMQQLSSRLAEVTASEGVEAAIRVCSQEAPAIAKRVSEELGVRIGRTSFKLRNTNNQPPGWAKSLVEQRFGSNQFLQLDDGTTAAFLAIRLQPQCMLCHGPKEQLTLGVKQQLAALYPEDNATGFESGDLRGWFWVEVPPEANEKQPAN